MADTRNEPLKLTRFMVPGGEGIEAHPCGLLYKREDVDPFVAALAAERDALQAENLKLALQVMSSDREATEAMAERDVLASRLEERDTTITDLAQKGTRYATQVENERDALQAKLDEAAAATREAFYEGHMLGGRNGGDIVPTADHRWDASNARAALASIKGDDA